MATHPSILAWRIPWTEKLGYSPQSHKESDTTEVTSHTHDKNSQNLLNNLPSCGNSFYHIILNQETLTLQSFCLCLQVSAQSVGMCMLFHLICYMDFPL